MGLTAEERHRLTQRRLARYRKHRLEYCPLTEDELAACKDIFTLSDGEKCTFQLWPKSAIMYGSLVKLIRELGGKVVRYPTDHSIKVVDADFVQVMNPPRANYAPPDTFRSDFVMECLKKRTRVDLNDYGPEKSQYCRYNANDILTGNTSWDDLIEFEGERVELNSTVKIAPKASNVRITVASALLTQEHDLEEDEGGSDDEVEDDPPPTQDKTLTPLPQSPVRNRISHKSPLITRTSPRRSAVNAMKPVMETLERVASPIPNEEIDLASEDESGNETNNSESDIEQVIESSSESESKLRKSKRVQKKLKAQAVNGHSDSGEDCNFESRSSLSRTRKRNTVKRLSQEIMKSDNEEFPVRNCISPSKSPLATRTSPRRSAINAMKPVMETLERVASPIPNGETDLVSEDESNNETNNSERDIEQVIESSSELESELRKSKRSQKKLKAQAVNDHSDSEEDSDFESRSSLSSRTRKRNTVKRLSQEIWESDNEEFPVVDMRRAPAKARKATSRPEEEEEEPQPGPSRVSRQPQPQSKANANGTRKGSPSLRDDGGRRVIPARKITVNVLKKRPPPIPYSDQEKKAMVHFVIENDMYKYTGGLGIWKELEESKLPVLKDRTHHSLWECWRKRIQDELFKRANIYNLTADQKEKFKISEKLRNRGYRLNPNR